MQIGVAGLGRMGAAIATRLMEMGHQLVVWNRTHGKAEALPKASAATTPAALASRVEVIITILTDPAAIEAVYSGAQGLLSGDIKGKLFIEMSTVPPATQIALAGKVRAMGAAFVDCPVGGTIGPALQGKLIGLMGALDVDAARAKPILDQLCRRLEHCGPVGTGCTMKLAINLPLMVSWQAYGEALALCRNVGFEPARLLELFADTGGGTNALKLRGPAIAALLAGDDAGAVTFDVDTARKDMQIMLDEGRKDGIELPLVERTLGCFDELSRKKLGAEDTAMVPAYWAARRKSG